MVTILEWITAIGAIATPILLAIFAGVGWAIRRRIEEQQKVADELRARTRKLEEELREDRIAVYNKILEPFILIFMKDEGLAREKAYKGKKKEQITQEIMTSVAYREAAFKLSLFGSDNVVRAYNDLMQYFYTQGDIVKEQKNGDALSKHTVQVMNYFGSLLLEIRKSVGNESTELNNIEMLEWLITDVRRLQRENTQNL
jgi:hypothetical protein